MALVGEERRLVEGRGGESFVVGVGRRAIRIPFFAKVRLALRLCWVYASSPKVFKEEAAFG
jgi:hypothetical protein